MVRKKSLERLHKKCIKALGVFIATAPEKIAENSWLTTGFESDDVFLTVYKHGDAYALRIDKNRFDELFQVTGWCSKVTLDINMTEEDVLNALEVLNMFMDNPNIEEYKDAESL